MTTLLPYGRLLMAGCIIVRCFDYVIPSVSANEVGPWIYFGMKKESRLLV